MTKETNIVRFTPREIAQMMSRGEDMSDMALVSAKSEAQLEADISGDPSWDGIDLAWFQKADLRCGPMKKEVDEN